MHSTLRQWLKDLASNDASWAARLVILFAMLTSSKVDGGHMRYTTDRLDHR